MDRLSALSELQDASKAIALAEYQHLLAEIYRVQHELRTFVEYTRQDAQSGFSVHLLKPQRVSSTVANHFNTAQHDVTQPMCGFNQIKPKAVSQNRLSCLRHKNRKSCCSSPTALGEYHRSVFITLPQSVSVDLPSQNDKANSSAAVVSTFDTVSQQLRLHLSFSGIIHCGRLSESGRVTTALRYSQVSSHHVRRSRSQKTASL